MTAENSGLVLIQKSIFITHEEKAEFDRLRQTWDAANNGLNAAIEAAMAADKKYQKFCDGLAAREGAGGFRVAGDGWPVENGFRLRVERCPAD
jgi:hypothetical protein